MPRKPKQVLDMKHGIELTKENGPEIFKATLDALKTNDEALAAKEFEAACLSIKNLKSFEAFMISRRLRAEIEEWLKRMPADFQANYRAERDRARAELRAQRQAAFEAEQKAERENSAKFFVPAVS